MSGYILDSMFKDYLYLTDNNKQCEMENYHYASGDMIQFLEFAFDYNIQSWIEENVMFEVPFNELLKNVSDARKNGMIGLNLLETVLFKLEPIITEMSETDVKASDFADDLEDLTSGLWRYDRKDLADLLGEVLIVNSKNPDSVRSTYKLKTMFE